MTRNINFAAIWCTRAAAALWIARKLRFDSLATGFPKAKLGPHPFHDTGSLERPKSTFQAAGPRKLLRPAVPNVPSAFGV